MYQLQQQVAFAVVNKDGQIVYEASSLAIFENAIAAENFINFMQDRRCIQQQEYCIAKVHITEVKE